jgi:hypothetical protein
VLALVTIAVGLCAGFVAPPSVRWVLALAGGALFFFVAAFGIYGWDLAWKACGLMIAVPIVAARMAATKWSTPDVYDDE